MKRSAKSKIKRSALSKRKKLKKKLRNILPKWQWNPANGKYEMTETTGGITYKVLLDQMQWLRMMDKCINRFERKAWLTQNNLKPKPTKNHEMAKKPSKR